MKMIRHDVDSLFGSICQSDCISDIRDSMSGRMCVCSANMSCLSAGRVD